MKKITGNCDKMLKTILIMMSDNDKKGMDNRKVKICEYINAG